MLMSQTGLLSTVRLEADSSALLAYLEQSVVVHHIGDAVSDGRGSGERTLHEHW